jgi:polyvinyl alcohol dehydrogenase (cytochrome)
MPARLQPAYDAGTGVEKWSFSSYLNYGTSLNPTFSNGTLYIGTLQGYIQAINAATGQVKWSYFTNGQVLSGPCIIDGSGVVHHPAISGDQQ